MVVSSRLICIAILVILISPRHPSQVGIRTTMMMMGAEGAVSNNDQDVYPPGPAFKEWRLNTNFENVENWEGLRGHENCSRNIYSFPTWYDEEFVVSLTKVFTGKQIILPVNAHLVFRGGEHTFLNKVGGGGQEDTCEGREVEFVRTSPADWFHPDNWAYHHPDSPKGDDDHDHDWDNKASLLNAATQQRGGYSPSTPSSAIPHVERVPCQYDSAFFRGNSSFSLKISSNVTISRFYLGDKKLGNSGLATFLNTTLAKLQFQLAPQASFSIRSDDPPPGGNGRLDCSAKDGDSDRCICSNYLDGSVRQRICSLVKCNDEEDNCPNPIIPHGFCCSVCGFHVKLRHSGSLKLNPVYTKVKSEVSRSELHGKVQAYITRYKEKGAHVVILPGPSHLLDLAIRRKLFGLVSRLKSILEQESGVIGVTVTESWGRAAGDGGSIDRLEGSGLGGGLITLIVFLVLVVILTGIALFIFMWNRKHGYPTLTLSSVTSALPRMSSMRIPIVSGGASGGRRSSTFSSTLHSFGFARFTNERMSTVTISPGESTEVDVGGKPAKSSSFRKADKVDDQPLPLPEEVEKVTDANSGAFGFSNVTYDLVAGVEGEEKKREMPAKKGDHPVLTIPEVTVVEMDKQSSTSQLAKVPAPAPVVPSSEVGAGSAKEEKPTGKIGKPGFVASRLAKTYQKLGASTEQVDSKKGEESKKGKKKGKKTEGTFKVKRLEEEDSDDDVGTAVQSQVEAEKPGPDEVISTSSLTTGTVEQPEIPQPAPQQQQQEAVEGQLVNLE